MRVLSGWGGGGVEEEGGREGGVAGEGGEGDEWRMIAPADDEFG